MNERIIEFIYHNISFILLAIIWLTLILLILEYYEMLPSFSSLSLSFHLFLQSCPLIV